MVLFIHAAQLYYQTYSYSKELKNTLATWQPRSQGFISLFHVFFKSEKKPWERVWQLDLKYNGRYPSFDINYNNYNNPYFKSEKKSWERRGCKEAYSSHIFFTSMSTKVTEYLRMKVAWCSCDPKPWVVGKWGTASDLEIQDCSCSYPGVIPVFLFTQPCELGKETLELSGMITSMFQRRTINMLLVL